MSLFQDILIPYLMQITYQKPQENWKPSDPGARVHLHDVFTQCSDPRDPQWHPNCHIVVIWQGDNPKHLSYNDVVEPRSRKDQLFQGIMTLSLLKHNRG